MPPEIEQEFRDLAPAPSRPLDMARVWERGLRLRQRRRIMFVAGAASAVVLLAVGTTVADFDREGRRELSPATSPTETASPPETDRLREVESVLQSQRRRLREEIRGLNAIEKRMRRELAAARASGEKDKARQIERSIVDVDERARDLEATLRRLQNQLHTIRRRFGDFSD